jgi:hypothetical protein
MVPWALGLSEAAMGSKGTANVHGVVEVGNGGKQRWTVTHNVLLRLEMRGLEIISTSSSLKRLRILQP